MHKKSLPIDEIKLRALNVEFKTHGRLLLVVDQPHHRRASLAVARTEDKLVAHSLAPTMRRITDLHAGEAKTDARTPHALLKAFA